MQSLHPTANTQWWYTKPGANIHENKKQKRTFAPGFFAWEATKYTIYGTPFVIHHGTNEALWYLVSKGFVCNGFSFLL